jgi:hypothetical protein
MRRRRVIAPEGWSGPTHAPQPARVDGTLVKALARAHHWQAMLEGGAFATIEDLARGERINRVLRLILLALEIVEAILDGQRNPQTIAFDRLMRPFLATWGDQLQSF